MQLQAAWMNQALIKLPTDKLLSKFGSGGHKPGSGSAAALLGLVACKLTQTVVSLSAGRDQYQGVEAQLTLANQDILEDIEPILMAAMQEDSEQFDRVIGARRLRDAEVDRQKKRVLSERALGELRDATDIPIRIAETCLKLAEKAIVVFDLGFKAARGDSGVAISSALAGASGATAIIYLNLTSFKGGEWAVQARSKADELSLRTQTLQVELLERITRLQREVLQREGVEDQ
jgi:formiminotetrahydrofolate cyclodeaminase